MGARGAMMGARGAMMAPHFYGTLFARKDRDTLMEHSGSVYSNRAVPAQYSEKQCSKLLSYTYV